MTIEQAGHGSYLWVHLRPRSRRARIVGWHGDALKVEVPAPAVGGKANAALIELMAATLQLKQRRVTIVAGQNSRRKRLFIEDLDPPAVSRLLGL